MADRVGTGYVEIRGDFSPLERQIAAKMPALTRSMAAAFNDDRQASFNRELATTRKELDGTTSSFNRLRGGITQANSRFTFLRNTITTLRLPALAGAAGAGAEGLVAMAGGAVSLTSALAPLTGALVAYPALLGAVGQAAGVVALSGVDDLTDALGGNEDALKRLNPEARQFYRQLKELEPRYRRLQSTAQGPLFEGLDRGLDRAMDNFPALNRVIAATSDEMGSLASQAGRFLGREGFGRDFEVIGKGNARLMGDLGDASFNFADALRHVMVEAQPLLGWMGKGIISFSEFAEEEAKAGRESGDLAKFFRRTRDVMDDTVDIGGSLINIFGDLGHASAPFGREMIDDLRRGANELERITGSVEGQNDLRDYFRESHETLEDLGDALLDILDEGELEHMLTRAIELAVPVVAENAGQIGVAIVKGLANGFMDAGALGKLFTAAAFIRLIGGRGALTGIGAVIGGYIARGTATSMASTTIATGAGEVFQTSGRKMGGMISTGLKAGLIAGGGLAILEAFTTEGGIIDTIEGDGDVSGKLADAIIGEAVEKLGNRTERAIDNRSIPALRRLQGEWGDYIDQMNDAGEDVPDDVQRMVNRSNRALGRFQMKARDIRQEIHRMQVGFHDDLGDISKDSEKNFRSIERSFGTHSETGRRLVERNFAATVRAIKRSMKDGRIATDEGTSAIRDLIKEKLSMYGISSAGAEKIIKGVEDQKKGTGGSSGFARGGVVTVPGQGLADSVALGINGKMAARVAPGEDLAVVNRHQRPLLDAAVAKTYGVNGLGDFFQRFDKPHYMAKGGLMSSFNVDGAQPGFVPFMNFLNGMYGPIYVMSGFRSGSITTSGNVSNHASGRAVDISTSESGVDQATGSSNLGGPGAQRMDALHSYMARNIKLPGDFLWRTFTGGNHYNHIHRGITSPEASDPQKMIQYLGTLPGGGEFAGAAQGIKLMRFQTDFPAFEPHVAGLNNMAAGLEGAIGARLGARAMTPQFGTGKGVSLENLPPALEKYNRRFKGALYPSDAWFDLYRMPFNVGAAIAEWSGLPGVTFAQVSLGEGDLRPGSMGDDNGDGQPDGYGWLAITRPYGDSYGVDKFGGYEGMLNPIANAIVASRMYETQGPSAWYGIGSVTGWNQHYNGPLLGRARGGLLPGYAKGSDKADKGPTAETTSKNIDLSHARGYRALQQALKLREQLNRLVGERGRVAKLDEKIQIAGDLASLASSPAGSELSAGERAKIINLNTSLWWALRKRQELDTAGLLTTSRGLKRATGSTKTRLGEMKRFFDADLVEVQGVTGKGGRLHDLMLTLKDLHTTPPGGAVEPGSGLDLGGLRELLEARTFGVFAGGFAKGGFIPAGKVGLTGERGPELIRGPAHVTSTEDTARTLAGRVEVRNEFAWEGFDLIVKTYVNDELAARERTEFNAEKAGGRRSIPLVPR